MLRQIYIFHNQKPIFRYALALGLGSEDLKRVINLIEPNMILPTPGQTLNRSVANFQIFHRSYGNTYFIIVVDLIDSFEYVEAILIKLINKFKDLFANPDYILEESPIKREFIKFLYETQGELHSKIAIVGPVGSGKTTLYNLLKSGQERKIMDFANASIYTNEILQFDLWDFVLNDNFSLLWAKFIGGSDLIILLFDSKDYGPKLIQYFMNIIDNHGKHSKVLIIANKSEYISDEELEHIKISINIQDIIKLSLIEPEKAREKIEQLIRDSLNLKKSILSHIETLQNEAKKFTSENKIPEAIVKYEELIDICNEYQDYEHLELFQNNLEKLKNKLKLKSGLQKKVGASQSFNLPEKIKFTHKISVKKLPKTSSEPNVMNIKTTLKSSHKSQKIDSSLEKPKELIQESKPKKLTLKPEDIKLNIKSKIEKLQQIRNVEPEKIEKTIQESKVSDKIKLKEELNKKKSSDLDMSRKELNPSIELQNLIIDEGSSLNIELCEFFIKEMTETLKTTLSNEDLKLAAELFHKIENSIF